MEITGLSPPHNLVYRSEINTQSNPKQLPADNNKLPQSKDSSSTKHNPHQKSSQTNNTQLSESEQRQVNKLKSRDREVRAHEAAHLAAAGQYAMGGPTFDYHQGPDGKRYAIGGEVKIDTSDVPNNPEATIQKARQIRASALAPADPSSQDRQVAANAEQMEAKARMDLQKKQQEQGNTSENNSTAQPKVVNNNKVDRYQKIAEYYPQKTQNNLDLSV